MHACLAYVCIHTAEVTAKWFPRVSSLVDKDPTKTL